MRWIGCWGGRFFVGLVEGWGCVCGVGGNCISCSYMSLLRDSVRQGASELRKLNWAFYFEPVLSRGLHETRLLLTACVQVGICLLI